MHWYKKCLSGRSSRDLPKWSYRDQALGRPSASFPKCSGWEFCPFQVLDSQSQHTVCLLHFGSNLCILFTANYIYWCRCKTEERENRGSFTLWSTYYVLQCSLNDCLILTKSLCSWPYSPPSLLQLPSPLRWFVLKIRLKTIPSGPQQYQHLEVPRLPHPSSTFRVSRWAVQF